MTAWRQFRVESECELLAFLLGPPVSLSRKQAKGLLRFHRVEVGGKTRLRHDTRLWPGDIVEIVGGREVDDRRLERVGLRIVYIDDAIVVVDKSAGLLSMGSDREKERTVHRILNDHLKATAKSPWQEVFIVHRLDRESSGLMVLARHEPVQAALQRNWKEVTKKYLAIAEGVPTNAQGTLHDNLIESKSFKMHRIERGGVLATTHYRLLRSSGERSLLELTLETGRKHQIRVQLAAIGHPIVGDRKYGATSDDAPRLALHSCELKFRHPVSGAAMEFRSALPGSLRALIEPHRKARLQ
jgi:23S rRNA pseudouridine1911/1915/1917 synthase